MPDIDAKQISQGTSLSDALNGKGHESSLMQALRGIKKFFTAKPASASNDEKYRKALEEAGIEDKDTGIGN